MINRLCETSSIFNPVAKSVCIFGKFDGLCGQAFPLKTIAHFMQDFIRKDFIELDNKALSRTETYNSRSAQIPLWNASGVKIGLYPGEKDTLCPPPDAAWAERVLKLKNTIVSSTVIPGKDHLSFSANDLSFFAKVLKDMEDHKPLKKG